MTSQQIELFFSVAKHLNFTKASAENHISQPTTSRQIALLEEELGVKLFHRSKSAVSLTTGGRLIAKELEYMQRSFLSLLETVRNIKDEISGRLCIGYMSYLNTDIFVHPLVTEFLKRYPNVEIRLESATFSVLRERLLRGEYDLIFTYSFDMRHMDDVLYKKCYPVSHVIAMSSTHPLANKRDLKLEDLSGETFFTADPSDSKGRHGDIHSMCERFNIRDVTVKSSGSIESIMYNVVTGKGVAMVSSANTCYLDERYTCIPIPEIDVTTYIAAVWNAGERSHIVSLFTDLVTENTSIDVFFT